jgi:hypothetical protein
MKYRILLLLIVFWCFTSCNTTERAYYIIHSDPSGASIHIGDADYGTTPDTIRLRFLKQTSGSRTKEISANKSSTYHIIRVSPVQGMRGRLLERTDTLSTEKYPSGSVIFFDLREEPHNKISPVQIQPVQKKESPATQREDDRTIIE